MKALYEATGQRVGGRTLTYETRAAVLAGQRVWVELHGRSRPTFAQSASAGKQAR